MMPPVQVALPAPQPFPPMPVQNMAAEPEPRPRIRLQAAEEQPSAPPRNLGMPPPESLGLSSAPAKVDWNAIRERLRQLGATNFRVDPLGAEGYRVRIQLRTNQAVAVHEIETIAGTETAAVAVALEQAERWKKTN